MVEPAADGADGREERDGTAVGGAGASSSVAVDAAAVGGAALAAVRSQFGAAYSILYRVYLKYQEALRAQAYVSAAVCNRPTPPLRFEKSVFFARNGVVRSTTTFPFSCSDTPTHVKLAPHFISVKYRVAVPSVSAAWRTGWSNHHLLLCCRCCCVDNSKLDFDDLLVLCVKLLETQPAIATVVASGCHHLLVDEFQVPCPRQNSHLCRTRSKCSVPPT